ncbi:MAG: glycosyltransferase [Bacteroidales bacterium]|nr:glycosyltransferase [Bacteroidales bacterium]
MKTPAISVIVPVYKAENYLHRCVDSILAQTFTDFEVLLVDDGSPDRSGEICDEYAQKDDRVRVFHKENGGVSSARNVGIDNALGEYTIHADPDDWVEPNMLEELYKKAQEEDADMVFCDFYMNKPLKQTYKSQYPTSLYDIQLLRKDFINKLHGSTCNKLIRAKCYKQQNIRFNESIAFCEDKLFILEILKHINRVSYMNQAFYHYDLSTNENSLAKRNFTQENYLERKKVCELLKKELTNMDYKRDIEEMETYLMLWPAFFYSKFTSSQFMSYYYEYNKKALKLSTVSPRLRILFFFSCIGFYKLSISIEKKIIYIRDRYIK